MGPTATSDAVLRADHAHLVHPLHNTTDAADPFVWASGDGALLRTADGREYIDGLSCLWNVNVGHGRKELAHAAAKQMESLAFASSYVGQTNVPAAKLAERLAAMCYNSINHFFFGSGGGEANDSAIKTARYFWIAQGRTAKTKIISRDHAYHGVTMGAMSAAALSKASHAAEDVEARLRQMEVEASFRSAGHLGFDDLIHPEETRNALLWGLQRAVYSRQAAAEPVARTVITP